MMKRKLASKPVERDSGEERAQKSLSDFLGFISWKILKRKFIQSGYFVLRAWGLW